MLVLILLCSAARRRNKNHPSPTTTTHACALPPGAAYEPDMNRGHSSSSKLINEKLEEHRISTAKHCPHCGEKIDSKPVCSKYVSTVKLTISFCLRILCAQLHPLS